MVLRRRHRPSPGALDEPPVPNIEPFLPVVGSLLLTVPPTVLYFLNDYKSALPFAANYDAEGFLRYTYDNIMWLSRMPGRAYYTFPISAALDEMMEFALERRAVL